jgi:hypothetical protein
MQVLKGSAIYRILEKLVYYFQYSTLKKFFSVLSVSWKNSFFPRCFRALKGRNISENSLVLSILRKPIAFIRKVVQRLYKWADKRVLYISERLPEWSKTSLFAGLLCFVNKASKEKLFVLIPPIFGIGYVAGRLIMKRLMIRDIIFLALTFFIAAILIIDKEKLKQYLQHSLIYKLYVLVLE